MKLLCEANPKNTIPFFFSPAFRYSANTGTMSPAARPPIEPLAVNQLITQKLDKLIDLDRVAPEVTAWLKDALLVAHENEAIKKRIEQLLGTFFYTGSLDYLDSWKDLKQHCRNIGVQIGSELREFYEVSNFHRSLGECIPNTVGKAQFVPVLGRYTVVDTSPWALPNHVPRQDQFISGSFPRLSEMSQLYNEKIYAHVLRMVAMGLHKRFESACREIASRYNGNAMVSSVKDFQRIMSKCRSHEHHCCADYPRPSQNLDVLRNAIVFETPEDLRSYMKSMQVHGAFAPVMIVNQFLRDDPSVAG
jgi:hypothetical protein